MLYGIASYKRPECKTVKLLKELGAKNEDIIISTQTKEDYEEYKSRHECEVIYAQKDSAAGNRNTLLDYVKDDILLLDDDINNFQVYKNGKWSKDNEEGFARALQMFDVGRKNDADMFGVSATSNGLYTKGKFEYDIDVLLQGSVIGVLNKNIRFDERWKMVEDYEICLRIVYGGGRTIRNNYVSAGKPQNGTNIGGLHERYANGEQQKWIKKLAKTYPIFKANKSMTGGRIFWAKK